MQQQLSEYCIWKNSNKVILYVSWNIVFLEAPDPTYRCLTSNQHLLVLNTFAAKFPISWLKLKLNSKQDLISLEVTHPCKAFSTRWFSIIGAVFKMFYNVSMRESTWINSKATIISPSEILVHPTNFKIINRVWNTDTRSIQYFSCVAVDFYCIYNIVFDYFKKENSLTSLFLLPS